MSTRPRLVAIALAIILTAHAGRAAAQTTGGRGGTATESTAYGTTPNADLNYGWLGLLGLAGLAGLIPRNDRSAAARRAGDATIR